MKLVATLALISCLPRLSPCLSFPGSWELGSPRSREMCGPSLLLDANPLPMSPTPRVSRWHGRGCGDASNTQAEVRGWSSLIQTGGGSFNPPPDPEHE